MSGDDPRKGGPLEADEGAEPGYTGRAARSLGRGLEEISHHFLSPVRPTEPTSARTPGSDPAPERPATRSGVGVLRPGAPLLKAQLLATLRECPGALEDGMLAIAPGLSCGVSGDIDLLGLDRARRITIIDVDTASSDALLLRGVGHVDWVVRNLATVQRLYHGWMIDTVREARLFLVAPRFSSLLRSAIRQIERPSIACFTYREIEHAGRTGIFVERLQLEED